VRAPVAGKLLDGRERHALREILDGLAVGQPRRTNTPAEILEVRLGNVEVEGTDGGGITHDFAPVFASPARRSSSSGGYLTTQRQAIHVSPLAVPGADLSSGRDPHVVDLARVHEHLEAGAIQ